MTHEVAESKPVPFSGLTGPSSTNQAAAGTSEVSALESGCSLHKSYFFQPSDRVERLTKGIA